MAKAKSKHINKTAACFFQKIPSNLKHITLSFCSLHIKITSLSYAMWGVDESDPKLAVIFSSCGEGSLQLSIR